MDDKKFEAYVKYYNGGKDYTKPETIHIATLDILNEENWMIDSLISELQSFKAKYSDCEIEGTFKSNWGDESSKAKFDAHRMEKPDETKTRVKEFLERARQSFEEGKQTARYYKDKFGTE